LRQKKRKSKSTLAECLVGARTVTEQLPDWDERIHIEELAAIALDVDVTKAAENRRRARALLHYRPE
jgi:hypothetical protein